MSIIWKDVQFSLRTLKKNPGFTLLAVLALALGIGANTAIYSVVHSIMFRPLQGSSNAKELVSLVMTEGTSLPYSISLPAFEDYRSLKNVFADAAGFATVDGYMRIENKNPIRSIFYMVTGNFFDSLGIKMAYGRSFTAAEAQQASAGNVAILGYKFWQRRFDGDPKAVGSSIRINGTSFTIIGIASKDFSGNSGLIQQTLYVPITAADFLYPNYASVLQKRTRTGQLNFIGRLKPGVRLEEAQTAVAVQTARMEKEYGEIHRGQRAIIYPEPRTRLEPAAASFLPPIALIFMILVGLVLLAACANVASLLYARASGRQKELAIRLALGSSRARILRQLLTESLLLSLLGSIAGIAIAYWLTNLLSNLQFATDLPLDLNFSLNSSVLFYALIIAVISGIVAGLMPGLRASNTNVVGTLKEGGRTSSAGSSRHRLRDLMLFTQVSISLVLLVCAGLFFRTTLNAAKQDLGFQAKNRVVVAMDTEMLRYDEDRSRTFYRQVLDRVRALPGVESAALGRFLPIGFNNGSFEIFIEGQEQQKDQTNRAYFNIVSTDYFETIGMPVLQGRVFNEYDAAGSKRVAIVNEVMAAKHWPGQNPLGRRFRFSTADAEPVEVVGVVKTAKYVLPAENPSPALYLPFHQNFRSDSVLHVHTSRNPIEILAAVRSEVLAVDPEMPLWDIRTLEEHIRYGKMRLYDIGTSLIGGFGLIALSLAAVGLYGVMALLVSQRTQEIGVRMALGASQWNVLRMIVMFGFKKTLPGLLIGIPLAIFATRAIAYLLVGVSPADPLILSASFAFMAFVAFIASFVPAWRASRVDPQIALHNE